MNAKVQDCVKLSKIKHLVNLIEKDFEEKDPELSFELVIGSLFPMAMINVKEALSQAYIEGYNAGEKNEN